MFQDVLFFKLWSVTLKKWTWKMYNSRRSGTAEAAELLHSQLAAESLFFKPTEVGSRETYESYTQWTWHRWKVPTYFTFQSKEGESTTFHSNILQGPITWRTGLSCTVFWPLWGMLNIYELQSVFRSIPLHCALPTEQKRKGRKNDVVITETSLATTVHRPSPSSSLQESIH